MEQGLTTVLIDPRTYSLDEPLALRLPDSSGLSGSQFFEFCQINRDLRIERTANKEIIVMPPTGGESGSRNSKINRQLGNWSETDGTGGVFDSSTGFELPDGAIRSPDAAWVLRSRLMGLAPEQKSKFLPLCPDFVIELRSPSDHLETLQDKLQEYIDNGCRLGWLIDCQMRRTYVYEPERKPRLIEDPGKLSGHPVLPGFTLDISRVCSSKF